MRGNQNFHSDNNNNCNVGINDLYKRSLHFLSLYYGLSTLLNVFYIFLFNFYSALIKDTLLIFLSVEMS